MPSQQGIGSSGLPPPSLHVPLLPPSCISFQYFFHAKAFRVKPLHMCVTLFVWVCVRLWMIPLHSLLKQKNPVIVIIYKYICIYNIFIYYFINRTVLLLLHRIPSTIPRELIKGNRGKVKLAKVLLDMGQGKRGPQWFFSSNEALSLGRGKQRGTSRGKKGNDGHRVSIEDRGLAAWQHVGPDFFVQCVS